LRNYSPRRPRNAGRAKNQGVGALCRWEKEIAALGSKYDKNAVRTTDSKHNFSKETSPGWGAMVFSARRGQNLKLRHWLFIYLFNTPDGSKQ